MFWGGMIGQLILAGCEDKYLTGTPPVEVSAEEIQNREKIQKEKSITKRKEKRRKRQQKNRNSI